MMSIHSDRRLQLSSSTTDETSWSRYLAKVRAVFTGEDWEQGEKWEEREDWELVGMEWLGGKGTKDVKGNKRDPVEREEDDAGA
jgi:hypothetical protein